jgi:hypothetical protein
MTQPLSTDLPPSSAHEAAIRALVLQGQHGSVAALARDYGVCRQKIYDLRDQAHAAVAASFVAREPAAPGSFTLQVTEADIARTVIALRVATPSSIRDEVALLPLIYGFGWSYGKIQALLVQAEQRAAKHLRQVDLAAVQSVALDEMFSQGRPVFGGIDLDSGYLLMLEVCPTRSGAEWSELLGAIDDDQHLSPAVVVKDAGSGLAAGVSAAWPKAEQRDDAFHAVYLIGKEAAHLERRAYGTIAAVEVLVARRGKATTAAQRQSLDAALQSAREHMEEGIARYDRFEALRRETTRMLALTERGSGQLRRSDEVTWTLIRIGDDMETLGGRRVLKIAGYLRNRAAGLGLYLDALQQRLDAATEAAGGSAPVGAVVRAYQASLEVEQGGPRWDRGARRDEMKAATTHLLDATARDPERLQRAVALIVPLLVARHRASSAIENLNSVLRPYLAVQKHAQQGFLDLFRFHWNTRTREWGRHKGTSAHELVTGAPVADWLTLLGYPPGNVSLPA